MSNNPFLRIYWTQQGVASVQTYFVYYALKGVACTQARP